VEQVTVPPDAVTSVVQTQGSALSPATVGYVGIVTPAGIPSFTLSALHSPTPGGKARACDSVVVTVIGVKPPPPERGEVRITDIERVLPDGMTDRLVPDDPDYGLDIDSGLLVAAPGPWSVPPDRSVPWDRWVQLRAPRGMEMEVRVHGAGRGGAPERRYRLVVVGSTDHIRETDIRGQHQREYAPARR
jgi:hypothetical protein